MCGAKQWMAGACVGVVAAAGLASSGSEYCRLSKLEWAMLRANLDEHDDGEVAHYDPETGRALLNFPKDRGVDYQHMRLEIDIPDMNTPRWSASQSLVFTPIAQPLRELRLDAHLLEIESVSASGRSASFDHDGEVLTVRFDPPIAKGQRCELVTAYRLSDPPDGLFWTPESDAWPGRPAQIHTQGQPETNSYWFPCHDFPNERLTTELIVTVPTGFEVSSNGRLLSRSSEEGRDTFRWLQDGPHPNYLVSMIVGKFDIVDLGTDELPAPVYVPPGRGDDVVATYGNTMRMVDVFEKAFDERYPWDRYAQLVVWNFGAGGMENTSATTMFGTAIYGEEHTDDTDLDGLIAHELGHQWFGDMITCRSWQHIWLNEGWATYTESIWFEARDGRDGYDADTLTNFDRVTDRDEANWPHQQPMASRQYRHPWEVFRREANPYPKGASTLHMLRRKLGDDVFFAGVRRYVDEHKFGEVETADFRRSMEAASGESLERFFHQWVFRPGVPRLEIETSWQPNGSGGRLSVDIEQTQNIDDDNPAFWFELPVHVYFEDETEPEIVTIECDTRSSSIEISLLRAPEMVIVDPDLHVLAELTIEQPATRWLAQLDRGPTLASRIQAARHLVDTGGPDAGGALESAARDASLHRKLRQECVLALGARDDARAIGHLVNAGLDDAYVRADLVVAIREMGERALEGDEEAPLETHAELLATLEADATSEAVRRAALEAIGALSLDGLADRVLAAASVESLHDRVRAGAIQAIGDLQMREGLDVVARHARPGTNNRTRALAIETLVTLAEHDPERVFGVVREIYETDRERRSINAAGQGLVDLGDARGVAVLEARAENDRDRFTRERASEWAEELRAAIEEGEAAGAD
ncbi:MAG: M1 family aminopeptidase [Planctomycetota bacterium]